MKGDSVLFSGAHRQDSREKGSTDEWGTPQAFFDLLNKEFDFTLDPFASADNAKAPYFDVDDDGLAQDWGKNVCFVNFPYSNAKECAEKCFSAARDGATVVVLCAARTDTDWWQRLAKYADEVRFVKGRLSFVDPEGMGQGAPFPSSVVILRPRCAQAGGSALPVHV